MKNDKKTLAAPTDMLTLYSLDPQTARFVLIRLAETNKIPLPDIHAAVAEKDTVLAELKATSDELNARAQALGFGALIATAGTDSQAPAVPATASVATRRTGAKRGRPAAVTATRQRQGRYIAALRNAPAKVRKEIKKMVQSQPKGQGVAFVMPWIEANHPELLKQDH